MLVCAYASVLPDAHSSGAAQRGLHLVLDKVRREIAAVVLSGICGGQPVRAQKRFAVFGDGLAFQSLHSQTGGYRSLGCKSGVVRFIYGGFYAGRRGRF